MLWTFIVAVTLLLDQCSKYLIISRLLPGESIPVLPPVFYFTYILNPGAAFGILAHRTSLFIFLTLVVITAVFVWQRYLPREKILLRLASGLVVGGALGNLIDRVRLGRVIDFLDFQVWPVFNLADSSIVIGALLLVIGLWRSEKLEQRVDAGADN
ncbi:Lipoprotein signal peptidase [Sporotomaculum syntrophicum]|uniref:Lipoprotein signal peptidase n=1 Tax=Sporotomaculum syntrophicum TaxID=182264 RepID=A0A9D2WQI0_9FIRM|nr:signal peptidase II [Sporotomaculum syntrophicum]KAF1085584.1 Lipoprotein signal peptidase [Sporotomaculum syntrophicum]